MKNIKFLLAMVGLVFAFSFNASAQNVVFTSLDGEKIDLEAQKGKVVVMAIGASWLPLSKQQTETINKLARKYSGRDVVFYFIATDSAAEKSRNFASNDQIRQFAERSKLTVTILRDAEGALTIKRYNVDQLPAFVILDKEGRVAGEPFGGIDPKSDISVPISQAIDKIL
ncbi:MAG TPA: TlpA disulfide reductase family protein [Pyrinomonadaceae bacterium]|nr:TlpA disulfide reductase family protein [Pyrinomonadaceae bacterium]